MLPYVTADNVQVPVLPRDASREHIHAYLGWLAASPFAYHLDDDAEDCGFPEAVGVILNANQYALWNSDAMSWNDIWEAYGEFCDLSLDGRA